MKIKSTLVNMTGVLNKLNQSLGWKLYKVEWTIYVWLVVYFLSSLLDCGCVWCNINVDIVPSSYIYWMCLWDNLVLAARMFETEKSASKLLMEEKEVLKLCNIKS
jgi:hypothetical protein